MELFCLWKVTFFAQLEIASNFKHFIDVGVVSKPTRDHLGFAAKIEICFQTYFNQEINFARSYS